MRPLQKSNYIHLALGLILLLISPKTQAESEMLLYLPAIMAPGCASYSIAQFNNNGAIEHRFFCEEHHFMTLVDDGGTLNLRPHPGVDINGWGTSWYTQPFLLGADLKHSVIQSLEAQKGKGIHLVASGNVSRGTSSTYGTWAMILDFTYSKAAKTIKGSGTYSINLAGPLAAAGGDLNLYKIASNYLNDVPLLSGNTGDTGDMKWVEIAHGAASEPYAFSPWIPPDNPGFFPSETKRQLLVNIIGNCNNVDTAAQGYAAIAPAFKPSMKVVLASHDAATGIRFGAIYDMEKRKDFWEDNVGITPIIHQSTTATSFTFDVRFESSALASDGSTPCP